MAVKVSAGANLLRKVVDNTQGQYQGQNIDPDADLISSLKAGDDAAFAQLMERHLTTIYNLAYYMVGDQMSAEDISQTVFLKTWQNISNWIPGQAKLITWMRRVATNACLDHLRKKKPIYTDQVPEIEDRADTPFEALSRQNQGRRVKTALMHLPERQRGAVTLSYYQGVSQREGAAIMEISEGAYESLLVRGRKSLKTLLETERADI